MAISRRALLPLLLGPGLLAACGSSAATPAAPGSAVAPTVAPTAVPVVTGTTVAAGGSPSPSSASPTPVGASPGRAANPTPTIDTTNARRGGRLVEGWLNDARTLNPLFVTDPISAHATSLLFNGLVRLNPDTLQPEGDLALRWTTLPEEKGFLFSLREKITFHDGRPCTAEDVKFTYDLLLSERVNAPRQADLTAIIDSVTVKSPTEVEFRFKQAFAPFLATHASYGILPRHRLASLDPGRIEQSEFSGARPVGTGPFLIRSWVRGSALTLGRFDGYLTGPPYLDEVVLKVIPDPDLLQTQLKVGEVDLALIRPSAVDELSRQQNLFLSRVDSLSITYLVFQLDPARSTLFQDRRLRQALGYALDRETMLRVAQSGIGRLASGTIPPPSWAASDTLSSRLSHDVGRAEQLLDGSGWRKESDGIRAREGKRLSFDLLTNRGSSGNRSREQYAQLIQEQWRKIGVEAKPVLVDFQEVVTRLRRTHEFDVCLTSFTCDADPDQRLLWSTDAYRSGFNAGKFSNPALDKQMNDALQIGDQSRRRELYRRIQETILEEMPAIVLDYPQQVYALNKRLRNVLPNPVALGYGAHLWWVADGK